MKHYDEYRWIWLLLMAATVGFIWQQSTLAPPESAATSDAVRDVVVPALGGPTSPVGSFFDRFLRKIAHFTEFAILGVEAEAYLAGRHTLLNTALQLFWGFAVAGADELLQRLTSRGSLFSDVLIDVVGYVCGGLLLFFLVSLVGVFMKKRKAGAIGADEKDV